MQQSQFASEKGRNEIITRRNVRVALGIMLLAGVVGLVSGYRFNALQAAAAHFAVVKPWALVDQTDFGWGRLCLFRSGQGYRTVSCSRFAFLWQCPAAVAIDHTGGDPLQTIGWTSWTQGPGQAVTFMAVASHDPQVAYIKAGPPENRVRQPISNDRHVVFEWPKAMFYHNIRPIAVTSDGKTLYEYRVPAKPHIQLPDDLRWYPAPSST